MASPHTICINFMHDICQNFHPMNIKAYLCLKQMSNNKKSIANILSLNKHKERAYISYEMVNRSFQEVKSFDLYNF